MEVITAIIVFILLGLAGLVVNKTGIAFFKYLTRRYYEIKKKRRDKKAGDSQLNNSILKYYESRGLGDLLYIARIGGMQKKIPFLTKESWHSSEFPGKFQVRLSSPLKISSSKTNTRLINNRKKYGQKLWDAPSFSLTDIRETDGVLEMEAGICSYFQFLSTSGRIEEETIFGKHALRDRLFGSLEQISDFRTKTTGVGTICLIAVANGSKYDLVLTRRSQETVTHGGKYAAIPCFSFQPLTSDYQHEVSFRHQIIREYFEELYDKEELVHKNKHMAYNWFYSEPAVSNLIHNLEAGKIEFIPLGFGIDALNCEPNVVYLILIKDREVWENEKVHMKINWESEEYIEKPCDDPFFERLLSGENIYYGTIFAISEALQYLNRSNHSPES